VGLGLQHEAEGPEIAQARDNLRGSDRLAVLSPLLSDPRPRLKGLVELVESRLDNGVLLPLLNGDNVLIVT
jgi:hypothetical protein